MATRLYFESGGQVSAPTAFPSGWTTALGVTALPLTKTKRSTADTQTSRAANGATGTLTPVMAFVSTPLSAQTISGTIKGQLRCFEQVSSDNYTLAVGVTILKPDGTERAVLLSPTASDDTSATPPEMVVTTATNRRLLNSSEGASISLTSQSATEGDRLCVVIGARQSGTATSQITIQTGSASGTDLAEDDTTTTANNGWIEFSGTIAFQPLYWFGSVASPTDNGAANEPVTTALTPPTGMLTGDLVIIGGQHQVTTADVIAQSELGGQSWTAMLDDTGAGSNDQQAAFWFCEFDGTWDANPSIAFTAASGTQPVTAFMHVFRGGTAWAVDVTSTKQAFAGATTVTITAQNPVANHTITFGGWFVGAPNTWGTLAGTGWQLCGDAQYRNTAGSDQSATFSYIYVADGAAPANVSKNQSATTAGLSFIGTLKGTPTVTGYDITPSQGNLAINSAAPTIQRTSNANITVSQANLSITSFAPTVTQNLIRTVAQTNLAISVFAPTIAQTNNVTVNTAQANLAITASAPTIQRTTHANVTVSQANLQINAAAPTIAVSDNKQVSPSQANLQITASAPTIDVTAGLSITPAQANLAISVFAPTIATTAHRNITVSQANLAITSFAPTVTASDHKQVNPSQADLRITASAPTINVTQNLTVAPSQSNLVITASAPTVTATAHRNVTVGQANLAVTSSAPSIEVTAGTQIFPLQADLQITASAPTIARTDHKTVTPAQANLAISVFAPTVTAGANINVTVSQSNLQISAFAPSITVTTGLSIEVPQASLAINSSAPTISRTAHIAVNPAQTNLEIQGFAPSILIAADKEVFPEQASLSITTFAPTISVVRPPRVATARRTGNTQTLSAIRANAGSSRNRANAAPNRSRNRNNTPGA